MNDDLSVPGTQIDLDQWHHQVFQKWGNPFHTSTGYRLRFQRRHRDERINLVGLISHPAVHLFNTGEDIKGNRPLFPASTLSVIFNHKIFFDCSPSEIGTCNQKSLVFPCHSFTGSSTPFSTIGHGSEWIRK